MQAICLSIKYDFFAARLCVGRFSWWVDSRPLSVAGQSANVVNRDYRTGVATQLQAAPGAGPVAVAGGGDRPDAAPNWSDRTFRYGLSHVAARNGSLSRGRPRRDSRFHDSGASLELVISKVKQIF